MRRIWSQGNIPHANTAFLIGAETKALQSRKCLGLAQDKKSRPCICVFQRRFCFSRTALSLGQVAFWIVGLHTNVSGSNRYDKTEFPESNWQQPRDPGNKGAEYKENDLSLQGGQYWGVRQWLESPIRRPDKTGADNAAVRRGVFSFSPPSYRDR